MLPTTRRRRMGVSPLMKAHFARSEKCGPHVGAVDLGSHYQRTLFYHFYKIGTSLNIIESNQTPHGATLGMCLQCLLTLINKNILGAKRLGRNGIWSETTRVWGETNRVEN